MVEGDFRAHRSKGQRLFGVNPMAMRFMLLVVTAHNGVSEDTGEGRAILSKIRRTAQIFPVRARDLRINWVFAHSSICKPNCG